MSAATYDGLRALQVELREVAREDTAYDAAFWRERGGLASHCGAVAYVVQQRFGGEIITGRIDGVSHYWNRVNEIDYDLTGDQFDGRDNLLPRAEGRIAPARKMVNPRFKVFADRLDWHLIDLREWENAQAA